LPRSFASGATGAAAGGAAAYSKNLLIKFHATYGFELTIEYAATQLPAWG